MALVLCGACVAAVASAQRTQTKRARTIVVGPSDQANGDLPTGSLRVAWRRSIGAAIDAAPLVDARGEVTVLAARGDVVVLDHDGEERSRTPVGASAASPPARLRDGTVVFVTTAGDAVGVRLGSVRFRTRVGGGRADGVAPLSLDDGGVIVATASELTSLDGDGNVRARASVEVDDPIAAPLVAFSSSALSSSAFSSGVYVITSSGTVLAWPALSGRTPSRVGSFGAAIDGAAVLDGSSLLAVVGSSSSTSLVALDPLHGDLTTRASSATLGVLALLGPPAVSAGGTFAMALGPSRVLALSFDKSGNEAMRAAVAPSSYQVDGGAASPALPPHIGPLADARGTIAFATPSGDVGIAATSGATDTLGEPICARPGPPSLPAHRAPSTFAGLTSAGRGAFIVACTGGVVARIESVERPAPQPQ